MRLLSSLWPSENQISPIDLYISSSSLGADSDFVSWLETYFQILWHQ